MELKQQLVIGTVVAIVVLIVALVSLSFADVQYYEFGFLKRKSTGTVDTRRVYTSGRHLVGPDFTFKTFRADAHFEELKNIGVFTNDKLEVQISCTFQYFLKKEDLAQLHKEYDLFYKPVIRSTALAAVKGRAALLPINEYIRDRVKVERELYKAMEVRLGGVCCRKDCASKSKCAPDCKAYSTCKRADKGLFVEVRLFQLHSVIIPNDVKSRYLHQVIESANEEKETFVQKEKIVRKETERLIQEIDNVALVIIQNATAQATLAKARATSGALVKVEAARNTGLSIIYQRLGITSDTHKASFNYLRALRNRKDVKLNVDYDTLMARGN